MCTIKTERLELFPWEATEEMAIALYEYAKNPEVGPAAGWEPHDTPRHSLDIIRDLFIPQGDFAIRYTATGEIIGSIGLMPDKRRDDVNSRELGYSLARHMWGKGIMTEAARALIDYGFRELDLELVSGAVHPKNERSLAVAAKCGFHRDGILRMGCKGFDGSNRDLVILSILRSEWMEMY